MKLRDKIALVTGSSKGIGRTIATALAREGCDVVINGLDIEAMNRGVEEIKNIGRRSISIEADVCNQKQVINMIDKCVETFGRIDILVNNAGGTMGTITKPPPKVIGDVTEDHWDLVVDINLKGTFLCIQAAVKYMKEQKRRRVAVGTLVAQRPPHRSVRAALPHTALASGNDEKVNKIVYFSYPLKRTVHTCPALCPECVLLKQISFGQLPSLHPLRSPLTDFVRRLLRYCGVVRLPMTAHHRLTSSDFPMRPLFP